MPAYTYHCPECGQTMDAFKRIADRDNGPYCCGEQMTRQIAAPAISGSVANWNFTPHYSPGLGKVVHSEKERREAMKAGKMIDAREVGDPKLKPLDKPQEIPEDLKRSMKRDGLGHMLQ